MNETLKFLLMSLLIVVSLWALAHGFERFFCKGHVKKISSPKYIATVGMSSALAGLLMLIEIPLLFLAPEFYKLDFSELPIMICSFYLGPSAGVLAELFKILIKLLFKSTSTAYVGELANFVIGCSFVLTTSMIYHLKKSKETAMLGLCAGTVVMTVFGSLFNALYLLPTFAELFGMPLEAIIQMGTAINSHIDNVYTFALFAVAPLNLIKGALLSALSLLLYKRVESALFRRL